MPALGGPLVLVHCLHVIRLQQYILQPTEKLQGSTGLLQAVPGKISTETQEMLDKPLVALGQPNTSKACTQAKWQNYMSHTACSAGG